MNFLADEGIDRQIITRLRQDGHRVIYVAEMRAGISDNSVLDMANKERALLIAEDKDFSELVFRQHRLTEGVILIRLSGLSSKSKANIVASAINKLGVEMERAFTVITPNAIRIRRPKS